MPTLYDLYKHPGPWDKDLPADLIAPIKHLRKTFDEHHWSYGRVTEKLCYWNLHPGSAEDEIKDFIKALPKLKSIAGEDATAHFIAHLKTSTAPSVFIAFFDLYLETISVSALAIFYQLVAIGKANEQRLGTPHLEWAEAQVKNMVRSHIHVIRIWVRNVCDVQLYTPEDMEEQIHWNKWQAPMFLVMKPSRFMPNDPAREWERNDTETSSKWLDAFAADYVLHLEVKVEKAAGIAAVELAKQPRPPASPEVPASSEPSLVAEIKPSRPKRTRLETQKIATQAKYKSWRQEYKALKSAHPDKSDMWHSLRISRMAIGKSSSPETIRKHMKSK